MSTEKSDFRTFYKIRIGQIVPEIKSGDIQIVGDILLIYASVNQYRSMMHKYIIQFMAVTTNAETLSTNIIPLQKHYVQI